MITKKSLILLKNLYQQLSLNILFVHYFVHIYCILLICVKLNIIFLLQYSAITEMQNESQLNGILSFAKQHKIIDSH